MLFAEYLHRLDPVLLRITDSIQLRWYGIAYVVGFYCGWLLLQRWAKRGIGELKPDETADFITYAALFGVLIGGRLGYMLLYNRSEFFSNPLSLFHVTGGGMASHGGIAGLFLFTLWWARRHQRSWTGLGDNLVTAAPVGLCFGRLANFVNGELYGRPTTVPWAMKFPEEATRWASDPEATEKYAALSALLTKHAPPDATDERSLILSLARENDAFAEGLRPLLSARHPSQLYEAALEGGALFLILFVIREKWPKAPHGLLTGLFFILYAVFRIIGENYREPDAFIHGLTEGQYYSLFMIAVGAAFLIFAATRRRAQQVSG